MVAPAEPNGRDDERKGFRQKLAPGIKRAWPLLRRLLTLAFLALVLWLLINHAQKIDWPAVKQALAGYSWTSILLGCALAGGSYLAYSAYDLFGRHYVRHGLSTPRTMLIAFICCAFTLNLGAVIGSVGFRYRMYSQRGLGKGDITHILGMSLTTNWLGYIFLAGLVFASGSLTIPFGWAISNLALQILGVVFIAVVLGYFGACLFSRKRTWEIRGQVITLPSARIAVAQLLVASAHWLFMGAVIFSFLTPQIGYFPLLGVLLVSSIAGLIAHVPGALGVLEAVFIALLGDRVDPASLVAALIAYRAVFYLLPLAVAVLAYVISELGVKKRQHKNTLGQ